VFDITIFNNEVFEGIEHFSVGNDPPSFVVQGNPSEAVILIIDIHG